MTAEPLRLLLVVFALCLTCAGTWWSRPVQAAPEPAPVPRRWEFDVIPSPLRFAVVDVPGVGPRAYVYLTYKVVNHGAHDQLFAPTLELATDHAVEPVRSGRDVPLAVTRELLSRLNNPYLEDQISIVGTLLRGPENAREGLAIWPAPSLRLTDVAVYLGGFSGETTTLDIPGPDGTIQRKTLRKTLMLRFRMPGEIDPAAPVAYAPYETRWIMR